MFLPGIRLENNPLSLYIQTKTQMKTTVTFIAIHKKGAPASGGTMAASVFKEIAEYMTFQ